MDWTAIYSEDGDEELLPPQEILSKSRLSRLVSKVFFQQQKGYLSPLLEESSSSSSYTLKALYFLTINYILGVGCLGIPYAFAKSGMMLGVGLVIIVTVLSYVTVMWVAETGVRYEQLISNSSNRNGEKKIVTTYSGMSSHSSNSSGMSLTSPSFIYSDLNNDDDDDETEHSYLLPSKQRQQQEEEQEPIQEYEVINLISFFLGIRHKHLYQTSLMALMYIGLLAYSQVFVGSFSSIVPYCSYATSTIIFASFVIPLSCMELDEQISIQFVLALVRFLAIFIMIAGSVVGLFMDGSSMEWSGGGGAWVNWNGFGVAFSTALFSQLFQHSVPGLVRPLSKRKKEKVPMVFAYSLTTTCSLYLLIGITAATFFGPNTDPSVNLNFATLYQNNVITRLASKIVVFFPALDTLSVFPLIANTLGNNLLAVCETSTYLSSILIHISKFVLRNHDPHTIAKTSQKLITILFRLIASIPPLTLSMIVTDLSKSMQLAGVAGLYVAFFAPALLQRSSCRAMMEWRSSDELKKDEMMRKQTNVYEGWHSELDYTWMVLGFATLSLIIVFYLMYEDFSL